MITVINIALNKNNEIKTDILDLVTDLVSKEKLYISTKVKFLPLSEDVVRSKTLSLFQEIYYNIGEELWNMIEISDKDKEFLVENLGGGHECEEEGEEEHNEKGNDDINNEKNNENNNSKGGDKTEILSNDKCENNNDINFDEIKELNKVIKNGPISKEYLDIILDNLLLDNQEEKLNAIIILHHTFCSKFEQNKEVLIA